MNDEDFKSMVANLRGAQVRFFKSVKYTPESQTLLIDCKMLEKRVDDYLAGKLEAPILDMEEPALDVVTEEALLLAELLQDKKRIDWLEKLGIFDIFHSSDSLRAEIDRQMEKP